MGLHQEADAALLEAAEVARSVEVVAGPLVVVVAVEGAPLEAGEVVARSEAGEVVVELLEAGATKCSQMLLQCIYLVFVGKDTLWIGKALPKKDGT